MYLTQMLHRSLQQAPDRPLTVCGERTRTAREVVDRVARLAGALQGLGIEVGDRVGILSFNSDRYFELLLASWWLGAVAHPVNVRWSPAEITYALDDSGTEVLFADDACAATASQLAGVSAMVHCGDGCTPEGMFTYERLVATASPIPDQRRGDDAIAALLYTGGTTGFPKGVMATHRSLITAALGSHAVNQNLEPGGRAMVVNPMFHIAALSMVITQGLIGGTYVFLPRFDARAVLRAIEQHRIVSLALVPATVQMLCEHPHAATTDVSSVRAIGYGASPMPEAILAQAMRTFPHARFHQGYGMTETGMVTMLTCEDHATGGKRLRSAGQAAAHAEVRIVNMSDYEVPRGEIGEVITRGDHLMVGYWNKPELTAQAIQDGWLHTGDLGYMDDDGYVYLVDRLKDVIITGGENVYSTEVENALANHPAVAHCAVIGVPDQRWGQRVHAVTVLHPGKTTSADELRTHVSTLIAGYKAPRSVVFSDTLPTTPTGKIDKKRLRNADPP